MLLSYETSSLHYTKDDLVTGKFFFPYNKEPFTPIPTSVPNETDDFYEEEEENAPHIIYSGSLKEEYEKMMESWSKPFTCSFHCPYIDNSIEEKDIRIFCNVYGVFADLTGRFAYRYDDYKVPTVENNGIIVDVELMMRTISKDAVKAILSEEKFWRNVAFYPFYEILWADLYGQCKGNFFLLMDFYGLCQLDDRVTLMQRRFGMDVMNRLYMLNMSGYRTYSNENTDLDSALEGVIDQKDVLCELIQNNRDILIDSDLFAIERWIMNGGAGYWWPEISGNAKNPTKIINLRLKTLRNGIGLIKTS